MPETIKPEKVQSETTISGTTASGITMPETIKLYDSSAYDTQFFAEVLLCEEKKTKQGSVYQVILDRTLFFPEEGGQSPDKGILETVPEGECGAEPGKSDHTCGKTTENECGAAPDDAIKARVLDVQLERRTCGEGAPKEWIVHTLDVPIPAGKRIRGEIDWSHRFSNMQQHTGEHIFSGIVHSRFGLRNVGFHLSDSIVTMDYDGVLSAEQIAETEWEANRAIVSNLPVEVTFPTPEEEKRLSYRSKIEVQGRLRIVTIPGVDVCACCAPHVRRTGEIGMLKVMQVQNYKGGVRLSILCGFRALAAFREKAELTASLTQLFSTGQDKLLEHLCRMKDREQELKAQLSQVKQEHFLAELEKIPAEEKHIILFSAETDPLTLRRGVNFLTERHTGICGIFSNEALGEDRKSCAVKAVRAAEAVENDSGGAFDAVQTYRFIIGSSGTDCRKAAEILKNTLGAKGGGSSEMVQGSVHAKATEIQKALADALFGGHPV